MARPGQVRCPAARTVAPAPGGSGPVRIAALPAGRRRMAEHDLVGELDVFLAEHETELIDFRRDLHAHPEVGYSVHRTTGSFALRLEAAGLAPGCLPTGTGLIAEMGTGGAVQPVIALRAYIDALP